MPPPGCRQRIADLHLSWSMGARIYGKLRSPVTPIVGRHSHAATGVSAKDCRPTPVMEHGRPDLWKITQPRVTHRRAAFPCRHRGVGKGLPTYTCHGAWAPGSMENYAAPCHPS